ncbi:MAG: hypothetical protein HY796_01860 [Elusimicrobia bacterium]|nr:hypothetical protein [Elusimicrobiota bacterium]
MTEKEFVNRVTNSKADFLKQFFNILKREKTGFCVIGGLAVNVYAEPLVSLDLDVVVALEKLDALTAILAKKFKVRVFERSVNVFSASSDIRIQIQRDGRYQGFVRQARIRKVLGYKLPVAGIADVLRGKVWAYSDATRRPSKRQKDLADIMRLLEAEKGLSRLLPAAVKRALKL